MWEKAKQITVIDKSVNLDDHVFSHKVFNVGKST